MNGAFDTELTKTDQAMLSHLMPLAGVDTYLCGVSKYIKSDYIWSTEEKVKAWVERNGGTMKRLAENPVICGEQKGFKVQIRFPMYTKRDMKNIMATLFQKPTQPQEKNKRQRRDERSI